MHIRFYEKQLPPEAVEIRNTVFVKEQGFVDEYDEIDDIATHFVMYDAHIPIATCRIFLKDTPCTYYLGRFAVVKAYRGRHVGTRLMEAVENYVRCCGGHLIRLHAQAAAAGFYSAVGYMSEGDPDEEQGCPHCWMIKTV